MNSRPAGVSADSMAATASARGPSTGPGPGVVADGKRGQRDDTRCDAERICHLALGCFCELVTQAKLNDEHFHC
jgi:hypothetical protein